MPRRLRLLGVPVVVAFAGVPLLAPVGGWGAAAGKPATTTVYACVIKDSGVVRLVKRTRKCRRPERKLGWARRGAAGLSGPQGQRGEPGAAADAGAAGAAGAAGPAGGVGPAGPAGGIGPAGPAGSAGGIGPAGPAGVTGYLRVAGTASAFDTVDPKTVTAVCPGGRVVVGGGYKLVAATGNVGSVTPTQNQATSDTEWTVTGDSDGVVADFSVQAFAICASVTP